MFIDDFTMVIPTYNRPRMLATALTQYVNSGCKFRIVVGDSSSDAVQRQNADTIGRLPGLVTHVRYPAGMSAFAKFFELPNLIETPFGMYAADDDIVLIDGVLTSLEFLRVSPEFVGCHGIYYKATLRAETGLGVEIAWASVSLDLGRPLDRILALCQRYTPITYCIQRRETFIAARPPTQVASPHFWELYNAFRVLIEGKVAGLDIPYIVRNDQLDLGPDFMSEPINWIMRHRDIMSEEFVKFRDRLAKDLEPHVNGRSAVNCLELAYITYFIHGMRINTMLTRLERDGELEAGSASNLIARARIGNSAQDPPEHVCRLLRSFMNSGWPRFG